MPEATPEPDDLALMCAVRSGDEEAFERLVERHQQRVMGTIVRMLGGVEEAEDLAQQVFIRVWTSASRWQPTAKFTTWLLTITRNLVFNETRRRGRSRVVSLERENEDGNKVELCDGNQKSPSENLLTTELEMAIDVAIRNLGEQARLALILRRYEELSYEEIAEVLECSVPAVKSLLFRARSQLREELAAFLNE